MDTAIVGGGIGGLTAALALQDTDVTPVVYEARAEAAETGAGIQLSPNAVKVLHALGLRAPLAAIGHRPEAIELRDARSGRLIARRPLGAQSEARYGAPYYNVDRPALHAMLREAANARGIPVEAGMRCTDLLEEDEQVALVFEGDRRSAGLVVGADGIHSRIRSLMLGADAPRFTGNVAFRGLIDADRIEADRIEADRSDVDARAPRVTAWLGAGRHLVHYPVSGGRRINFVAVVESDTWTDESWTTAAAPGELAAAFADWHPAVRALLGQAGDVWKWALHDRTPLPRWSDARVTLLGDACHPMVPFLAQGACMAIEDAWVLARCLEDRDEDEPRMALRRYQQARGPRTARVQRAAREQGERFHARAPLRRIARDLELGLGSRLLPELAMARFDWLHGYDAVARFD
ncbi:MAG: FAD-dependent monooxygenase [Pseudomonadales bacterium]|jgi:salicylate hydroxylase|nr:FAD-dependent monooxygenase [Pseudomonadales bacterium]